MELNSTKNSIIEHAEQSTLALVVGGNIDYNATVDHEFLSYISIAHLSQN